MNGILMRQMQLLARTERDLKPIFHKRKLIYGFAEAEEGINITDLMATMAPQADKLTTVKYILAKTESDHWGALTNRENSKPFHTPTLMESGAALVLLLYAGTKDELVDWRNIGYGSNIPVYRNRLQRIFNRATQEAKIHLLCNVTAEDKPSEKGKHATANLETSHTSRHANSQDITASRTQS